VTLPPGAAGTDPAAAAPPGAAFVLPPHLHASLVLVRHGESTWVAEGRFQGSADPPLSPRGEEQARQVAARLRLPRDGSPLPVGQGAPLAVWHSPLARARDTAGAIADASGYRLVPDPDLREMGQGEWEGLLGSEVVARWPDALERWRRTPTEANAPGGETLLEAATRVRGAVDRVVVALVEGSGRDEAESSPVLGYRSAAPPAWAVVVAHDGILRLALLSLLGIPLERFWTVPFVLCGITVLELRHGSATLRAHNLAEHLAPLAEQDAAAAAEAAGERRGAL
jgi:broad specificity phosphatase PhoE